MIAENHTEIISVFTEHREKGKLLVDQSCTLKHCWFSALTKFQISTGRIQDFGGNWGTKLFLT